MKFLRLVLLGLFFISIFSFASAQNVDWIIDSFNAVIDIRADGVVTITETISADFKTDRHGIYRDIPVRYDSNGLLPHYTFIQNVRVTKNGSPEEFEIIKNSSNWRIKVGSADVWVSGQNVYDISYQISGVLRNADSVDELYWNVTGNGWDTTIKSATASVTSPVSIAQAACYQGVAGSKTKCEVEKKSDTSYQFQASDLAPGEGLTISTGWQPGGVTLIKLQPANQSLWLVILASFIGILSAAWFSVRRYLIWKKDGRDPTVSESIVVQFSPPTEISPAESMFLIKDRNSSTAIAATIMSLAQKGYLTIEHIKGGLLGIGQDTKITLIDGPRSSLRGHENDLLAAIEGYADNDYEVMLSSLKNKFYTHIKAFQEQVGKDVYEAGCYTNNPLKTSRRYLYIGFPLLVILCAATIMFGSVVPMAIIVMILIAILLIPGFIFMYLMPQRTKKGTETLEHVLGYQEFIQTAEKHRSKFYEDKNIIFEMMPYAVAFGLVDKLKKQLDKLISDGVIAGSDVHPAWFVGGLDGNSLNDLAEISNNLSTVMQSAPGGSGSGGGGSSGGGFGGGGGGSW